MNYSLCALHSPVNYCTFLTCLILVFSINHNVLATTYDMDFEKRPRRHASIDKERTHYCKYMEDFAIVANCESWSCWESQMRDTTRIEFLHIYNWYRWSVFKGECPSCKNASIPIMIQLEWHWWLEKKSQKAIRNCPKEDFYTESDLDVRDDDTTSESNLMQCEKVATSFSIQGGSQKELISRLPVLLHENYLADTDEHGEYRRNLALYIGCSYIPTIAEPGHTKITNPYLKGATGYLLCYYCSKEKTLRSSTTSTDCPPNTKKSEVNEFPELCKLTENKILIPCETTTIPCSSGEKSYTWMLPNTLNVVAQLKNGTQVLSNRLLRKLVESDGKPRGKKTDTTLVPNTIVLSPIIVLRDSLDKKFCIILLLIYVIILSLMMITILLIYRSYLFLKSKSET